MRTIRQSGTDWWVQNGGSRAPLGRWRAARIAPHAPSRIVAAVKFSLIFEGQTNDASPGRERQVLRDCVDQAVYAEEMGFDAIWAVEHHALTWYAHMSAPEIFLAFVAARTNRIRLGHGCVLMPFGFNHPVRVAERVAMLDILCDGRLDVGAGRGATQQEMGLFGVKASDTYAQVEETLRILSRIWREERFEWTSDTLTIPNRPIHPHPVQTPHPPLFMACTKRDTVRLAADYGIGALVLGFGGADEIAELRAVYDAAIASRTGERFVSDRTNDHLSALCPTIVLDDADEAFRIGTRGQRFFAESISHWYGTGLPPSLEVDAGDNLEALKRDAEHAVARLHEMNIPIGPAATKIYEPPTHAYGDRHQALEYARELIAAGADEIMCICQLGTVPHEVSMETIRQWGTYVIPVLRAES
jgi:alkanesulfonate monooxygenase SsuD/methylene tetrahydromethanopterin reductase-like flavin-dependent oxidoreductase (luciferase family)